ncbi:hypothetical protein [Streptomyces sp. NPDC051776]|uniref:hypothetical protein n=1 Tax=Streptomyces sp. NPDC051776 TaxID=3155414 RepID=UPI00343CDA00
MADSGHAELNRKEVLHLKHVETKHFKVGGGLKEGDRFGFSGRQYEVRTGQDFGTYGGECTVLSVDRKHRNITHQCYVTSETPRGQITLQGIHTEPLEDGSADSEEPTGRPSDDAVTGGTRDFAHVSGFSRTVQVSPTTYDVTYYLG